MMKITQIIALAVLLLVQVYAQQNMKTCVTNYNSATDYFPAKSVVTSAKDFTITYFNNYKVLNNSAVGISYVLTQCGTPAPNASNFPSNTQFYNVPITKVWTVETTDVTFLELLGLRLAINVVSSENDITSPCLIKRVEQGLVAQTTNTTAAAIAASNDDLAFGGYTNNPKEVQTEIAGDPGIKNRAEWLKFFGVFFNVEDVANALFNNISSNIDSYTTYAQTYLTPKRFAFVSYSLYNGPNYNIPGYVISTPLYKQQLVQAAGGIIAPTPNANATLSSASSAVYSTLSALLLDLATVDVLIDETYYYAAIPTLAQVLSTYNVTSSTTYPWVNSIFRYDATTTPSPGFGEDWFDAGEVLEDAAVSDFINAQNSSAPYPGYTRFFLRNVRTETTNFIASSQCADVNSASLTPYASTTRLVPPGTVATSTPTSTPTTTPTSPATTTGTTTGTTRSTTSGAATSSTTARATTSTAPLAVASIVALSASVLVAMM